MFFLSLKRWPRQHAERLTFAKKLLKLVYVNVGAMRHSGILFRFYRRKTREHNLFYIKSVTPTAALAGGSSVITGRIFRGDCWRFLSRLDSSPPDIYVILARSSRFTTPGACNEEKNTIQITREGLWVGYHQRDKSHILAALIGKQPFHGVTFPSAEIIKPGLTLVTSAWWYIDGY